MLSQLATFTRNTIAPVTAPKDHFLLYPQPTLIQARRFELLGVTPRLQAVNDRLNLRNQRRIGQLRLANTATSA